MDSIENSLFRKTREQAVRSTQRDTKLKQGLMTRILFKIAKKTPITTEYSDDEEDPYQCVNPTKQASLQINQFVNRCHSEAKIKATKQSRITRHIQSQRQNTDSSPVLKQRYNSLFNANTLSQSLEPTTG